MTQKIIVGPIDKGIRTDRTAFVIDNDSFPVLVNAYQWRGRVKRKRGTSLLGRLTRFFNSNVASYSSTATIALSGGAANILTGFSLQASGNIVLGSVTIVNTTVAQTYTDNSLGILTGNLGGTGTINYATGAITISGGAGNSIRASFLYYPDLAVMGLEDLILNAATFPGTIAFDTTYAYNINTAVPYSIYDVSFYKNPPAAPPYNYPAYVAKTVVTPVSWNGQNYQQFWTVNYQGALWATNGITVPFTTTKIGMQYKPIITVSNIINGPPAIARITLDVTGGPHNLVKGDFLFINEVVTTTGINFQTGYVVSNDPQDPNFVVVEFPEATITTNGTGGIAQYLTNRADVTKDGIRWYDGDPTDGNPTNPTLSGGKGWVNFAPPLSQAPFSIGDLPERQYYLVGARMIVPFKDRLLFLGPVVQTSTAGSQVYLQDTVIYSQNGTPYYTCSYTNTPSATVDTPTSSTNEFTPILTPINNNPLSVQTATSPSYFCDQAGFGGFITAGYAQPIVTVSSNEDVLMIGFTNRQTRFVYTGNDLVPFNFFVINSELGAGSTFSSVNLDRGAITVGSNGIVLTSQVSAQRIDLQIPDNVFQFNLTNNGPERICSQRDFINEWIYFTYLSNEVSYSFPNQTLQYNYRDGSWAVFNECYTTYGTFRKSTGYTWATIGVIFPTWKSWNEPWNAGSSTLLQPQVIGGNQQGFVILRDEGTNESNSLYITGFAGSVVTSPNHSLNNGDYIVISGCLGTIGTIVNGNIYSVASATTNTFTLNPTIGSGTYVGGGLIKRMYVPRIQTKQFPVAWGDARKTRLGFQQYLLSTTPRGQIQLLIFLSQNGTFDQNANSAYNTGPVIPEDNSINNSLVYSTVLYTCPESTNLGLTPANTNLQMVTAMEQDQIWHRINTSLLGDTVQVGFTMSDSQMRDTAFNNQFSEIELHCIILTVSPSQMLA